MTKHYVEGISLWEWCKEKGFSYYSVFNRMLEKNETAEQAAKAIRHYVRYDGKSLKQICEEEGVAYSSLAYRVKKGESVEEAVAHLKGKDKQ